MSRYRVTVQKGGNASRCQHFGSWWQAWRYARAMRSSGYTTTRERVA